MTIPTAALRLPTRPRRVPSFLTLALVLAAGCGDAETETSLPPRPVAWVAVGSSDGAVTRSFSGAASTDRILTLSFRSGGVLTGLDVRLGDGVVEGQLLAELDNVAARLAYEQARSQLNSAESQMNTARLALERTRALYEAGNAALSEYENARNAFRTAEAGHASAQRSVEIQNEQISYGRIVAPASGIIASVDVEEGENVSPGQPVAVLNAGGAMQITLGLPETVINRVRSGMQTEVAFAALPGEVFRGRVSEVSPSVDRATATYPVRVAVVDATEQIRTGMAATVTFEFAAQAGSGALIVPARAVGEDGQGRFVFVVEADERDSSTGVVRRRSVRVGRLGADGFEIVEGLGAGERVAVAGLQTLLDGQRVSVR